MSINSEFHHTVEVFNNSLRPLRSKNWNNFSQRNRIFVFKKKNTNRLIKVQILYCNKRVPFLSNTEVCVSHRYSLPEVD